MQKIMLVEDDDNLREIYSIRLTAEGYQIVMAHDGEEALAVAVKERPNLIITDAMMPKISGFDMLDILRSTPEMKDIKVIIMTALSSEEQRARGESLGANRYLVKSQVGIEDVVNVVHDVLGDRPVDTNAQPIAPTTGAAEATQTTGDNQPVVEQSAAINQPIANQPIANQPASNQPVEANQLAGASQSPQIQTPDGQPIQPIAPTEQVVNQA